MTESSRTVQKQALSRRKMNAIGVLLTYPSVSKAAKVLGVSRGTLASYMKDEAFKTELAKQQALVVSGVVASVVALSEKSVRELDRILDDTGEDASDALKVRAALGAIATMAKMVEPNQAPDVNVLFMPQWISIQAILLDTLRPYPDIRKKVAAALLEAENVPVSDQNA